MAALNEHREQAMLDQLTEDEQVKASIQRSDAFLTVFCAWLRARAARRDPNSPDDEDQARKLGDNELAAERLVFATPAEDRDQLLLKLEVFEAALVDEFFSGPTTHSNVSLGFGAIKNDLLALCD